MSMMILMWLIYLLINIGVSWEFLLLLLLWFLLQKWKRDSNEPTLYPIKVSIHFDLQMSELIQPIGKPDESHLNSQSRSKML